MEIFAPQIGLHRHRGSISSGYDALSTGNHFTGYTFTAPATGEIAAIHIHIGTVTGAATLQGWLYPINAARDLPAATGPVANSGSNIITPIQNSMMSLTWPVGAAPVVAGTKYALVIKNPTPSTSATVMTYTAVQTAPVSMGYSASYPTSLHTMHRVFTSSGDAGWGGATEGLPTWAIEFADGTVIGFPGNGTATNITTSNREYGLEWVNGNASLVVTGLIWSGYGYATASYCSAITMKLRINGAVVASATIANTPMNTSTRNEVAVLDHPVIVPPGATVAVCCNYGTTTGSGYYSDQRYNIHTAANVRKAIAEWTCLESTDGGNTFTRHKNWLPILGLVLDPVRQGFNAVSPINRRYR